MPTREDLRMALSLARDLYRKQDPEEQAGRCGSAWHPPGSRGRPFGFSVLRFLGTDYEVHGPDGEVRFRHEPDREPALWEQVHVLHYHNGASGEAPSGRLISMGEIPEGRLYRPNFEKRAVAPLLSRFGGDPEEIWRPAQSLGGSRVEHGDYSVCVPVFPRVPVTLVFWKQDQEFPSRLSILFDRNVRGYLPTEDIVLAAQVLALRLIGLAGRPRRPGLSPG